MFTLCAVAISEKKCNIAQHFNPPHRPLYYSWSQVGVFNFLHTKLKSCHTPYKASMQWSSPWVIVDAISLQISYQIVKGTRGLCFCLCIHYNIPPSIAIAPPAVCTVMGMWGILTVYCDSIHSCWCGWIDAPNTCVLSTISSGPIQGVQHHIWLMEQRSHPYWPLSHNHTTVRDQGWASLVPVSRDSPRHEL